jgi:hypothetical protein
MQWLRNKAKSLDSLDDAELEALAILTGVPLTKPVVTKKVKKKVVDGAASWLKNKDELNLN